MSQREHIEELFNRYIGGESSQEDIRQLMLQAELPQNEALLKLLMHQVPVTENTADDQKNVALNQHRQKTVKEVFERLRAEINPSLPVTAPVHRLHFLRKSWFRYGAAAVILVFAGLGSYLFLSRPAEKEGFAKTTSPREPVPGKEGAILTLDDGSTIILDSMSDGMVATQNNTHIALHDGQLAYNAVNNDAGKIIYNTLTTPRGRQFQLILADGTRVWLNSESSLRYPVAFSEKERKVFITGEVYFEVAKDMNKEFMVSAGNTEIAVLGTRFNITAYDDEPALKTTLLEGSVVVKAGGKDQLLRPGQQASYNDHLAPSQMVVNTVNTDEVIAWKNGFFHFNNADIKTVMRSLARWYNLDVVYEGIPPSFQFKGKLQRDLSLADVLEFLKTDIHFERTGNKIIIKND